jgi:hypothetical protein
MITGAIAYQTLQRESPSRIITVALMLQRHPWYAERWRRKLDKIHGPERMELLFMLAARWADDVRKRDRAQDRPQWHYINLPFKPEGEPVGTKAPASVNILTAIAENKRIVRREAPVEQRAVALTWLFHLVGDVHQPLHTAQLFTREYPDGDRGGNEVCVRVAPDRPPLDLHRLWDGLITSSNNVTRLRSISGDLQNRFLRSALPELASTEPKAWAEESFEIAAKIAYLNGTMRGTPRENRRDCGEVDAAVLPAGYSTEAGRIGDRRIALAGYRLAEMLRRLFGA